MCNCWSVGLDVEPYTETKKDKPVVLQPSEYFDTGQLKPVSVDKCISNVIKALWSKGIWTENSCCGHNGKFCEGNPSIVFANPLSEKEVITIRKTIREVDDREFTLFAWKLTAF